MLIGIKETRAQEFTAQDHTVSIQCLSIFKVRKLFYTTIQHTANRD